MSIDSANIAICEALGLPAGTVTSAAIILEPGTFPSVHCKMTLLGERLDRLTEIFKRYKLVEKTDSDNFCGE